MQKILLLLLMCFSGSILTNEQDRTYNAIQYTGAVITFAGACALGQAAFEKLWFIDKPRPIARTAHYNARNVQLNRQLRIGAITMLAGLGLLFGGQPTDTDTTTEE